MSPSAGEVDRLRTTHGRSTAAWVGGGLHEVAADHWLALSGATHADYNLALCHGRDSPVAAVRDRLVAHRRPAILALADADASPLVDAGWRQVGSAPLMVRAVTPVSDPDVRALTRAELPAVRALVARVFALDADIAAVAVHDGAPAWGLFDAGQLVSCLLAVRVDDAVVIWSMATDPDGRRQGYGARLLAAATAGSGATTSVLHASTVGEPFYVAAGYETVERWAFWSRPRWVLAA